MRFGIDASSTRSIDEVCHFVESLFTMQVMSDLVIRVASNLPSEWGWSHGGANGTAQSNRIGKGLGFKTKFSVLCVNRRSGANSCAAT